MTSPLAKIIQLLEEEAYALTLSPQVLSQPLSNIRKYLELIKSHEPIQANGPKKRAQEILRLVHQHSVELFVLCAVALNQQALGTVKWTRKETMELCGWWDRMENKPLDILLGLWRDETKVAAVPMVTRSNAVVPPLSAETHMIKVPGAWLCDVLKGREEHMFVMSFDGGLPATIELGEELGQAFLIMARMRGMVRN